MRAHAAADLYRDLINPRISHTAYKRFRHPNIIRCLDSVVTQSREDDGKIIYVRPRRGFETKSPSAVVPFLLRATLVG